MDKEKNSNLAGSSAGTILGKNEKTLKTSSQAGSISEKKNELDEGKLTKEGAVPKVNEDAPPKKGESGETPSLMMNVDENLLILAGSSSGTIPQRERAQKERKGGGISQEGEKSSGNPTELSGSTYPKLWGKAQNPANLLKALLISDEKRESKDGGKLVKEQKKEVYEPQKVRGLVELKPKSEVRTPSSKDPPVRVVLEEDLLKSLRLIASMTGDQQRREMEKLISEETVEPMKEEEEYNALHTLASVAAEMHKKFVEKPKPQSTWCDVGIVKGTSFLVKDYYVDGSPDDHANLTSDNLIDYSNRAKVPLEPGTAYKFRVAAVNSAGRGEWSEVSAFKTCLPGFPNAPVSITITKSPQGPHLCWNPPADSGRIIEYCVCVAVKAGVMLDGKVTTHTGGHLPFAKVYCGKSNQATIESSHLELAHIDTSNKPAMIFRIAAKNEKGYGPATQVRWLHEEKPVVCKIEEETKPLTK